MIQVKAMRTRMENMVSQTQDAISKAVESIDGKQFREDAWIRAEGGGGLSRILQNGNVFEKAGVNVSTVMGVLSRDAIRALKLGGIQSVERDLPFFATGVSVVIHPHNPMAPTVHANYRYFELGDDETSRSWWFGGGSDLTPSYLFEEDAIHFHQTLKQACDVHDLTYYPRFKQTCDEYFYLPHRGESRGIGGIFFDHLNDRSPDLLFSFVKSCADAFVPSYIPLVERRKDMPYLATHKQWQQLRRGRYVEFNLVYDRGTLFGLKTGGRIESILMSLPSTAAWEYAYETTHDGPEGKITHILRNPRQWV